MTPAVGMRDELRGALTGWEIVDGTDEDEARARVRAGQAVVITIGLPASGKSQLARKLAAASEGTIREVTKDELRELEQAPQGRRAKERWVVAQRDRNVLEALQDEASIIVHDTNFNPAHARQLGRIADAAGVRKVALDFTSVSVDECVRRDARRSQHVGSEVIWRMWQEHLYTPPAGSSESHLPRAVMVDIDGTLARMTGRGPYDWERVGEDQPIAHIVELVRELAHGGSQIVYMSGRDEQCREQTTQWLDKHVGVSGPLFMRAAGDGRKDSIVKLELYRAHVEGRWKVRFVLDDRDSVVLAWRCAGLPVLQVEYGTF